MVRLEEIVPGNVAGVDELTAVGTEPASDASSGRAVEPEVELVREIGIEPLSAARVPVVPEEVIRIGFGGGVVDLRTNAVPVPALVPEPDELFGEVDRVPAVDLLPGLDELDEFA